MRTPPLLLYPLSSPQDFAPSVGFEETSYTVDEGVTLEVCAIVTPPLCIGRNVFVQVVTLDGTATGMQTNSWHFAVHVHSYNEL